MENEITLCSLYWENDKAEQDIAVQGLKYLCKEIITAPISEKSKIAHVPGLIRFGLSGKPFETKFYYSAVLAQKINELTKNNRYDIIQVEHSRQALYIDSVDKKQTAKKVLVFHNIIFDQNRSLYQIMDGFENHVRFWLAMKQMRRWEPRVARQFDQSITVSERDRSLLLAAAPRLKVDVIPNGVDTESLKPFTGSANQPGLIFVGSMDYPPAVDATYFFYKQILPLVREKYPNIELWLVGRNPPDEIKRLCKGDDHVHITGKVNSVIEYYEKAMVTVVPLRAGGGTRLKILESMALGLPIVSTSIGCEGLDVEDGKNILIADTPELFTQQILRLIEDESFRKQISSEARKLVENKYDWKIITKKQYEIYKNLISQ